MKPFTVSGLLRAAAAYIEIHGHEQRDGECGGIDRDSGPCCPVIACVRLYKALDPANRHSGLDAMGRAIGGWNSIARWSDSTPTAEVLATMRRVARELETSAV